jgi:hypothetical protein
MFKIPRNAKLLPAIMFKNLHASAEQIEQAAFLQLCWARTDPEKSKTYAAKLENHWKEMEEWKKVVEEQIRRVESGKEIESTRLYMS